MQCMWQFVLDNVGVSAGSALLKFDYPQALLDGYVTINTLRIQTSTKADKMRKKISILIHGSFLIINRLRMYVHLWSSLEIQQAINIRGRGSFLRAKRLKMVKKIPAADCGSSSAQNQMNCFCLRV